LRSPGDPEFTATMTPGCNPRKHMMTRLIMEGFKRCTSAPVASDAKGLVTCAVHRSSDMRSLINEVTDEGVFDRELSENDVKIGTLPGFKDFDPGTPEGSLRWLPMQELYILEE